MSAHVEVAVEDAVEESLKRSRVVDLTGAEEEEEEDAPVAKKARTDEVKPSLLPYVFVAFGEDGDLHQVYVLEDEGEASAAMAATIEALVATDLEQGDTNACTTIQRLYAECHCDDEDDAWPEYPALAPIGKAGKWTKYAAPHRVPGYALPGAKRIVFMYNYA